MEVNHYLCTDEKQWRKRSFQHRYVSSTDEEMKYGLFFSFYKGCESLFTAAAAQKCKHHSVCEYLVLLVEIRGCGLYLAM